MPIAPMNLPFRLDWPPLINALLPLIGEAELYLVGGAVRDAILRRPSHDLDLATPENGTYWARLMANRLKGAYFPLDEERGVGRAIIEFQGERYHLDVARFRGDSLEADLHGRDFTMNAIAVRLQGDMQMVLDPLDGVKDLMEKRLRRCAPDSIESDPIRALRAIRQSVQFKLMIEPQTRADLRMHGPKMIKTSAERLRDEFMTLLGGPRPNVALRTLDALGLLAPIVPEVTAMRGVAQSAPHIYDVWEHTLNVVERLDSILHTISPQRTDDSAADSAQGMIVYFLDRYRRGLQEHIGSALSNGRSVRAMLVLIALLHDCGKPQTKSVDADGKIHFYKHELLGAEMAEARAMALRLSNEEIGRITAAVRHHMRPMQLRMHGGAISRRAIYRYWKAVGLVTGLDVCLLTLADYLGMVGAHLNTEDWMAHLQVVGALLDGYFNQREKVVAPPLFLNGQALMELLNLSPGREVGRLLEALAEAQAAGEVTDYEAALALVRHLHTAQQNGASDT